MSERLTDEQLREWRKVLDTGRKPVAADDAIALIDDALAFSARVAKLEEALRFLFEETKWKSADKDNMEFEGRVTCYQLDRARAALKDAPQ